MPELEKVTEKQFAKCATKLINYEHTDCGQGWLLLSN